MSARPRRARRAVNPVLPGRPRRRPPPKTPVAPRSWKVGVQTAGDTPAQQLALATGAKWAGASDGPAPEPLDAALIFAPIGALVPQALQAVVKGGSVVCGGIHMSDIPAFPYRLLWEERRLVSVANLTRADGLALMHIAAEVPLQVHVTPYRLQDANTALEDLRAGRVAGAAVLQVSSEDL